MSYSLKNRLYGTFLSMRGEGFEPTRACNAHLQIHVNAFANFANPVFKFKYILE